MIGIGVIGYGYWGPNLVRNFFELDGAKVRAVCDGKAERLALVKARYPTIETTQDFGEMLRMSGVDAVCVATPVHSHFKLARMALEAGKHVLVEKPIAST